MRPWCIRFFGRETRKSTKINSIVASTNNIIFWGTWGGLLRTSRQKHKTKKIGKKNWRSYYRCTCGIRITSRTLWTTTNNLEAGPAAKGRDNEGQMRRSHVCFFGLVATCDVPGTCPTQKLSLFFNLNQICLLYTSPSPRD